MKHITIQREHDVRKVWPTIVGGVEKIRNMMKGYYPWEKINVLGELLSNSKHCFLYIVEEDNEYAGFMVARLLMDEYSMKPIYHIWLLNLESEGLMDDISAFVHTEAKRHKCKSIRFESNRRGWDRIVRRFSGEPWLTMYCKEI